jgi:hypothetical protein
MNESLIGKFRAEAWVYANTYKGDIVMPQLQRFELKFAELIIRECARSVDRVYETAPPDHGCYDWATFPDGEDVLKHFGIEK